ncbi:stage III sporulation protein AE [Caproiciproducens sp. MSJ-32]|uniref:stage III sporulation protein AE n=1 Tax=Caproiciproducens sp. MSJ-32 TaxID=2841527 RepID=UPI001C100F4B|nr:stage III sporulation protein AE [Caproiciproducens sp. MSJ-32]MBU5454580.1 stage III sporulation protein AE [Caproiciproducens sp. MSJ-32]
MKNRAIFKNKIIVILLGIFFSLIFFPRNITYADDKNNNLALNEKIDEVEIKNQLESLYNYINNMKLDVEILNELDPVQYIKSYIENGEGNLSFKTILNSIINFLFKEVKTSLTLCISIIAIAIICSLIKNLQAAFSNDSISNIAFFACYCILIILLTKSFMVSINIAIDLINKLSDFMVAILPVLVMMISTIGGFAQAATLDPIVLATTIIIPRIYKTIIIPLILVSFVLQFINNISTEYKISNLCKLTKQITVWFQGIILVTYIGFLTVRGITSSTIDAVTLKTTKFAVDNFIPIVGKAFSDAISSVAGYALIIKNAVSAFGLLIIVLMMLYPIIKLILISIIYKLSASVIEPIADKRITSSIAAASDSVTLLISCVLCVSLMFFVIIGIIASAGKFVVGG